MSTVVACKACLASTLRSLGKARKGMGLESLGSEPEGPGGSDSFTVSAAREDSADPLGSRDPAPSRGLDRRGLGRLSDAGCRCSLSAELDQRPGGRSTTSWFGCLSAAAAVRWDRLLSRLAGRRRRPPEDVGLTNPRC